MSDHYCDRYEIGVPYDRERHCTKCWLIHNDPAYRSVILSPPKPPPSRRSARCLHLSTRTEFTPGCGGWMCKHKCDKGHEFAVPGGNCQTCPDYEADS